MEETNNHTASSTKWIILILGLLFVAYWFFIRPSSIRKECSEKALMYALNYDSPRYDPVYEACLHEKGLK